MPRPKKQPKIRKSTFKWLNYYRGGNNMTTSSFYPQGQADKDLPVTEKIAKSLYKTELEDAVKNGYFELVTDESELARYNAGLQSWQRNNNSNTFLWKRTDKPRPPRSEFITKVPKNSILPWTHGDHFEFLRESPANTMRDMFIKDADQIQDSAARVERYTEINDQYWRPFKKSELTAVRQLLENLVKHQSISIGRIQHMSTRVSESLARGSTGLYHLITFLMLDPVMENGKIVKFVPLDEEKQLERMMKYQQPNNTETYDGLIRLLQEEQNAKQVPNESIVP